MKAICLGWMIPAMLCAAELKDVKSVYLYPMMGGLDQHLANRLTKDHVFRVVSDPKLADALFTDQLGKQFEYRADHIKAVGAPTTAPAPAQPVPAGIIPTMAAGQNTEPPSSTFTKGRGTVFLVDARSREVVWSEYLRPKNSSSHELDQTAKRLAKNISKTLAPPSPQKKQ